MKKSLLVLLIAFASPLAAQWQMNFRTSTAFEFDIDSDRKEFHKSRRLTTSDPDFFYGQIPGYDTLSYTFADISGGERISLEPELSYSWKITSRMTLSAKAGLEVAHQEIDYYLNYWNHFLGYNPFTLGFGGPPVQIGSGILNVESWEIVPKLGFRAGYDLTSKASFWVTASVGYAYSHTDDYPLYSLLYQLARPIARAAPQEPATPSSNWNHQFEAGVGLSWRLSERWSLLLEQEYVWVGDYRLEQKVQTAHEEFYFGVEIDDLIYWKTSLGASYAF